MSIEIAILVGSLRKDSYSLKVAKALQNFAPKDFSFKILKIDDLAFYDEDIDGENPPASYLRFREEIKNSQAILFVSPEYNRSIPAVIKNALDVASRPAGKNVLNGKIAGIITLSQGSIGGFGANHHLRQILVALNVHCLVHPEIYLSNIQDSFENGKMTERTAKFLSKFLVNFESYIQKLS